MRGWAWAAIDAVLILVFAAIGRASHDEGTVITGVLTTAWPFLVGAAVGWALWWAARRSPASSLRAGLVVWPATVIVGMALRHLTGRGIAVPFIVVATLVLGVFLLGARALGIRANGR
ncbi:DUF3054 domain-containing protein [Calidifontibacter sp. DB0510]|uniref:DUF3054 domain-containing protein n=1 Tax=Metallococcus carri TaxID=1656884 RepID=A0A967AY01_9MICO|nr:DUF3054 domain-containing protein [Metallococcus carri]NHN54818.1 DUF3054 domain-containing protein [Metallococcus carri]NOP37163.1 DUF3054 family protein [Calidifontibacter sp. DB2511S]